MRKSRSTLVESVASSLSVPSQQMTMFLGMDGSPPRPVPHLSDHPSSTTSLALLLRETRPCPTQVRYAARSLPPERSTGSAYEPPAPEATPPISRPSDK